MANEREPITPEELDALAAKHREAAECKLELCQDPRPLIRQLFRDTAKDYEDSASTIRALEERLTEKTERVEQVEQAFAEYRGLLTYPEKSKGAECPWLYPPQGCGIDGDHDCYWWNCPETRKVGGDPGCALQRREFKNIAMQSDLAEAEKRAVPREWGIDRIEFFKQDEAGSGIAWQREGDHNFEAMVTLYGGDEGDSEGTASGPSLREAVDSAIAAAESAAKETYHAD